VLIADPTTFDPATLLGPFGLVVGAVIALSVVFRLYIRSSDRQFLDRDRYIARLEKQNDELLTLATRGTAAAEKATDAAKLVVEDVVAEELRQIRTAVDALRTRTDDA
jgi:hypothetical protein